jgi:hypothetical protein
MLTSRTMALFASHVPLSGDLRGDVVVHRMAAIAERACWTLLVVRGIVRDPPVRVGLDEIGTPDAVGDVPLGRQREIVISHLREVALLPLRSVDEGNVVDCEGQQRIRFGQIGQDDIRARARIGHDVGHSGLGPALVRGRMTPAARLGADVHATIRRGLCRCGRLCRRRLR